MHGFSFVVFFLSSEGQRWATYAGNKKLVEVLKLNQRKPSPQYPYVWAVRAKNNHQYSSQQREEPSLGFIASQIIFIHSYYAPFFWLEQNSHFFTSHSFNWLISFLLSPNRLISNTCAYIYQLNQLTSIHPFDITKPY